MKPLNEYIDHTILKPDRRADSLRRKPEDPPPQPTAIGVIGDKKSHTG